MKYINKVTWFEISVSDLARAIKFYQSIFSIKIQELNFGQLSMGLFPDGQTELGAAGALIQHEKYTPSENGTLIYISCTDVQEPLDRVEAAGGKIYQPKKQISAEFGFTAVFIDTEGNRIGLRSFK